MYRSSDARRGRSRAGEFVSGVVSNALGGVLAAGVLALIVAIWRVLTGPRTLDWSSLPAFSFTIAPTIWAAAIPALAAFLTYVTLFSRLATASSFETLLGNLAGWPAIFAIVVWHSNTRITHHRWEAIPYRNVNAFYAYLDIHFRTHPSTFTSVYLLLFPMGLVAGLVALGVKRLSASGAAHGRPGYLDDELTGGVSGSPKPYDDGR